MLAFGVAHSPTHAYATSSVGATGTLINALRAIGKDACIKAATKMEVAQAAQMPFSLHLRNAGLNVSDAEILANALMALPTDDQVKFRSFSVSYNPMLGDEGTVALSQALPRTVSEIGFVGCDVGDVGGEALLEWAEQATRLSVICVEDNVFSKHTKTRFRELATKRVGVLVAA